MAVDAQSIANALASVDEDTAVSIITTVVAARPELAPPVVNFAVPDLTYPPARSLTERRAKGVLKSFNAEKGFGFIDCRELREVFGHDVFVHAKQLHGLPPGTPVNFCVVLNKDNKLQAFDVMAEGYDGKGAGLGYVDMNSMGKGNGRGKGPQMQHGGLVKEELGQFNGTIVRFNANSGVGFIDCPDLKARGFPGNVYLPQHQAAGFTVGAQVIFTCFNDTFEQLQAKDLMLPNGSVPPEQQALRMKLPM
eukprot:TRINITY_DN16127_c0_g1_i1.p1 TRINITY_DN16127_c0_g1~~TRINITY_DN16127_c0_g1_i1.p1  ORF type:complete len:250 (+),score=82.02 TRINITY_DN16127_c0_g1_i1:69-818(+)